MRSTPWFHQRRSESAPPPQRLREPPNISAKEQEETTERLLRPTESAMNRQNLYWKLDNYMDRGFHSWSKMDLFDDCKRCMWTGHGKLKDSCKIRPVKVTLPPLNCRTAGCTVTSSLQTTGKPAISKTPQIGRGGVTWRPSMHSGVPEVRGQAVRRSLPAVMSLPGGSITRAATHYSIGV